MKYLTIAFLVMLLSGCFGDQVTRKIRVIAQAEVDGKIVEGSAVMALRWKTSGGRMLRRHKTEAVILELNDEHTVYVLDAYLGIKCGGTNISYWTTYVQSALGLKITASKRDLGAIKNAAGNFPVSASVSKTKTMPVMVSFEDETKRETMFHVTPENFSEKFGRNTKFIGLWFEFTDDPVTEAIEMRLPMMFQKKVNDSYREKYLSKGADRRYIIPDEDAFPRRFGKTAFKQEF